MSKAGSMSIYIVCTSPSTEIMIINHSVEDNRMGFKHAFHKQVLFSKGWFRSTVL